MTSASSQKTDAVKGIQRRELPCKDIVVGAVYYSNTAPKIIWTWLVLAVVPSQYKMGKPKEYYNVYTLRFILGQPTILDEYYHFNKFHGWERVEGLM